MTVAPWSAPTDSEMLGFATRFAVDFEGHLVHIERYSNHGKLLSDGRWVVVRHLWPLGTTSTTNPLYLNGSAWLYKNAQTWTSWRDAVDHMMKYAARPGTNGWYQIQEKPHEPCNPLGDK